MGNKALSIAVFPITNGSQDEYIESVTIPQLMEGYTEYSREFEYDQLMSNSQGMFGLAISCNGNASDYLGVKLEFDYGGSLGYVKSFELVKRTIKGLAGNNSDFFRIDIDKNFRNAIPFKKMRIVFGKYGQNADLTFNARLIIL